MQPELNFFPADVTLPNGGVLSKVRVVAINQRVFAFGSDAGRPVVFAEADLPGGWVPSGLPYQLATTDGVWSVARSPGCGCGSVLQNMSVDVLLASVGISRG